MLAPPDYSPTHLIHLILFGHCKFKPRFVTSYFLIRFKLGMMVIQPTYVEKCNEVVRYWLRESQQESKNVSV